VSQLPKICYSSREHDANSIFRPAPNGDCDEAESFVSPTSLDNGGQDTGALSDPEAGDGSDDDGKLFGNKLFLVPASFGLLFP